MLPSRISRHTANHLQIKTQKNAVILWVFAILGLGADAAFAIPVYEKTQGNDLVFKDGTASILVKTPYVAPEFKALLGGEGSIPLHVLYEARSCDKCPDDARSYYLQRADGKQKAMQFVYPGKIIDTKKGQLVYESRAFYGQCLPQVKVGYVVHQREHVGRRGYQRSVFVATVTPDGATEQLLERRLPTVTTTLQLVKRKVCFELPGKTRSVLKKPLDLNPRQGMDDEDEENDEDEKPDVKGADALPAKGE